jgi:hypothetical protein
MIYAQLRMQRMRIYMHVYNIYVHVYMYIYISAREHIAWIAIDIAIDRSYICI